MLIYKDIGFKNSLPSTTDWLSKWIDAYKKQTKSNEWQKKRPPWSRKAPKKESPQQLQTHNVFTYNVENTNGTNQLGDLGFTNKPPTILRGKERMTQGNQMYRRASIHWSTHLQRQENKTEKSSYGVDWLQKSIWYGPAKLDNRLF